ncbi:PepSY domain-containing protein [Parasphingopyxis algicola]|uniref:PepSY-associated TM helix domain-containing protein n=1 Tax=Parasphingopyxis algicola TaxID=2026624 RepID=UPI0015A3F652|nr:PepSY-associated TM helix domain-containing protein [Parasphingopyxis algicola]QLC23937.1 PepSY domain-containing protein [Parasphingopyxis algicola]
MTTSTSSRRQFWLSVHGWLGVFAALFLLLVALTGSALVFIEEMVEVQVGEAAQASAHGEWQPPDVMIDRASTYAGAAFQPMQVYYPNTLLKISSAFVYGQGGRFAEGPEDEVLIFMDAVNGRPLAGWRLEELWADIILHLHFQLLAGDAGGVFIAFCGIALFVSVFTGIYLWWPRRRVLKKLAIPKLRGKLRKVLFDLHGFAGIYFAVLIAILAFSGTQLSQPSWLNAVLPADYEAIPPTAQQDFETCDSGQPSPDQLAAVTQRFPTRTVSIYNPAFGDYPAHIRLKGAGDIDAFFGDVYAWIDCNGNTLVTDLSQADMATVVALAQYSVHSGRIAGPIGRLLVFLSGLVLSLLALSGIYLFLKRRLRKQPNGQSKRAGLESGS